MVRPMTLAAVELTTVPARNPGLFESKPNRLDLVCKAVHKIAFRITIPRQGFWLCFGFGNAAISTELIRGGPSGTLESILSFQMVHYPHPI